MCDRLKFTRDGQMNWNKQLSGGLASVRAESPWLVWNTPNSLNWSGQRAAPIPTWDSLTDCLRCTVQAPQPLNLTSEPLFNCRHWMDHNIIGFSNNTVGFLLPWSLSTTLSQASRTWVTYQTVMVDLESINNFYVRKTGHHSESYVSALY